jgi:predicted metal-dependent hydrolase
MEQFQLGAFEVEVIQKDIKNIHLSVYPPNGRIKISAPIRMNLEAIKIYTISKLSWIKQQQKKLSSQQRETAREYITQESHYYLGKRYLLKIIEEDNKPKVILKHKHILLHVRPNTGAEKRKEILEAWYREQLKMQLPLIIKKWEPVMSVSVTEFAIKKMKTKWGTCNIEAKRIWLNLELIKKPITCIEYIVVHEMVHLLERHHNQCFIAYMNNFLPYWKELKKELNSLPVSHINWVY